MVPGNLAGPSIHQMTYAETSKQCTEETYDNVLIIDNLPKVEEAKVGILLNYVKAKIFGQAKINSDTIMPLDESKNTKGLLFVEFETVEQANRVLFKADGFPFNREHTLRAIRFKEYVNYLNAPETYVEPEQSVSQEETEHLRDWLLDPAGRDQFAISYSKNVQIAWNQNSGEEICESRKNWADKDVFWSPEGSFLTTVHSEGIAIWGGKSFKKLVKLSHSHVRYASYSPNEKFIVTYSPPESSCDAIITVWETRTGLMKRSFRQRDAIEKKDWPFLKWSFDSSMFARLNGNKIEVFDTKTMKLRFKPLEAEEFGGFEWSPSQNILCYWIPEIESSPCRIVLLELPSENVLKSKTCFNVHSCRIEWQSNGEYLAILVDKVTKSKKDSASSIELFRMNEKDIPVEAVDEKMPVVKFAWETNGTRFAYLTQQMSKSFVNFYDMKASNAEIMEASLLRTLDRKDITDFSWSNYGRFIVLVNKLAGLFEFWDVNDVNLVSIVTHDDALDYSWDPSGRYFATVVSAEKVKNGHGYTVWDLKGLLLSRKNIENLCKFIWRPRPKRVITAERKKYVKKNLKKYSASFDAEDMENVSAAEKSSAERIKVVIDKWNAWRALKDKEYEALSALRNKLMEELPSKTVQVTKEIILEETEKIL